MMTENAGLLWAKSDPYKSLIHHMTDTGCCTYVLLTESCASAVLPRLEQVTALSQPEIIGITAYLSALHDIGKCHPVFQKSAADVEQIRPLYDTGLMKTAGPTNHFRHEIYTGEILKRIWDKQSLLSQEYIEMLSVALAMHHQGKSGKSATILSSVRSGWENMQDELEQEIREIFKPRLDLLEHCLHDDAAAMLIMGITILSDWIASGEYFAQIAEQPDEEYMTSAMEAAHRAIRAYGLERGTTLPTVSDFCALWPEFDRDKLRPIQRACEEIADRPNKLYLIEAPMGEGKTEAAVYLATRMAEEFGKTGIYIALPTSATSNQMNERINRLFQAHKLPPSRLLHSMAWLVDEVSAGKPIQSEDADSMSIWLRPLRRGLLSQNAVGTVDQALAAVLEVKYSVLRLLGLAEKVLIIDEVHAYDAYMSQIIERLLAWCHALNIPVVLLSATLPKGKKKLMLEAYGAEPTSRDPDSYPLITSVDSAGKLVETEADAFIRREYVFLQHKVLNDYAETANLALTLCGDGCICVLLNTVKAAQQTYFKLKEQIPQDVRLLLFHARFTAKRRQEIENECIRLFGKNSAERPQKAILVCTQVVEQSLDVDFDTMITEIAPIDLLLQRAGRVHRHMETRRPAKFDSPVIHVLIPSGEEYQGTEAVYEKLFLNRTKRYLGLSRMIRVPEDMRDAVETVYSKGSGEDETEDRFRADFETRMERNHAGGVILQEPHKDYFFAAECDSIQSLFMQQDADAEVDRAKTRLDTGTTRVALLGRTLYERIGANPQDIGLIKEVLMCSVNLRTERLGPPPADSSEGQGALKGCLLLPIDDSGSAAWNDKRIHYDDEIGVRIEGM